MTPVIEVSEISRLLILVKKKWQHELKPGMLYHLAALADIRSALGLRQRSRRSSYFLRRKRGRKAK